MENSHSGGPTRTATQSKTIMISMAISKVREISPLENASVSSSLP
jgi:hypothetical protein